MLLKYALINTLTSVINELIRTTGSVPYILVIMGEHEVTREAHCFKLVTLVGKRVQDSSFLRWVSWKHNSVKLKNKLLVMLQIEVIFCLSAQLLVVIKFFFQSKAELCMLLYRFAHKV